LKSIADIDKLVTLTYLDKYFAREDCFLPERYEEAMINYVS